MAQWSKVPLTKPNDLSSSPRTDTVEGVNYHKLSSDPLPHMAKNCMPPISK